MVLESREFEGRAILSSAGRGGLAAPPFFRPAGSPPLGMSDGAILLGV